MLGVDDFGIYSLAASASRGPESSSSLPGAVWPAVPGVSGNAVKLGVDAAQRCFRVRQP